MSKFIPLKNTTVNNLQIIDEYKEDGRWKVKCVCIKCGKECVKHRCHVQSGATTSCGCQKYTAMCTKNWKGNGDISGDYWYSLKRGAKNRGLEFNITIEYAWELFCNQGGMCAISGQPIVFQKYDRKIHRSLQTSSLDRIDSSKGYIFGNVWWVHKDVNCMKMDLSVQEMVRYCVMVADHMTNSNRFSDKWDKRFLLLAKHVSEWSKDPSTKVGAVIFDKNNRILSLGYNGLPRGINDDCDILKNRDIKLKTIIHAEINAILFANTNLDGCAIATWPFMPCSNCSSAIIQRGIKRCVFPRATDEALARWGESFCITRRQFTESGITLREYDRSQIV